MLFLAPDNFKLIWVGVQTQIKFKAWKSELIIIITSNFAGQKNADQKKVRIPNFFDGNWKSMLKMSQKRHFCEFKQKTPPKNAWSAFFAFLRLGVYFQDQMVWWRHFLHDVMPPPSFYHVIKNRSFYEGLKRIDEAGETTFNRSHN